MWALGVYGGGTAQHGGDARVVTPLRALLIEDDLDLLAAVTGALERDGLRVTSIGDAGSRYGFESAALDSCAGMDVIVIDQRLGSITGLELLARLRREGHTVPAILATAYADEATRLAASRFDACEVLEKPFCLEALLEAIERAVKHQS
jgi:DNA-binding NtrC family response regulator